ESLRRVDRCPDHRPGARARVRRQPGALRGGVPRRAPGLCNPPGHARRPGPPARAGRLLLLDRLGRRNGPPGNGRQLHEQLAYEPLVGNVPTSENIVWTGVSIIILLTGLGGVIWY